MTQTAVGCLAATPTRTSPPPSWCERQLISENAIQAMLGTNVHPRHIMRLTKRKVNVNLTFLSTPVIFLLVLHLTLLLQLRNSWNHITGSNRSTWGRLRQSGKTEKIIYFPRKITRGTHWTSQIDDKLYNSGKECKGRFFYFFILPLKIFNSSSLSSCLCSTKFFFFFPIRLQMYWVRHSRVSLERLTYTSGGGGGWFSSFTPDCCWKCGE